MRVTVSLDLDSLEALVEFLEWRNDRGPEQEGWDSPDFAAGKLALKGALDDAIRTASESPSA